MAGGAERPRGALLTVVADYVYVPAEVNADAGDDLSLGVPTSDCVAVMTRDGPMDAAERRRLMSRLPRTEKTGFDIQDRR